MEQDIKVRVCRLCFNLISDEHFSLIKDSLRDMLQTITTELDVDKTSFPVMCGTCSKALEEIFTFKTNIFESEERIEAKLLDMNNVKLDLRDIMINTYSKRPIRKSKRKNLRMDPLCRSCLKVIYTKKYFHLDDTNSRLPSILYACIPEMDLQLTVNPVMCQACYNFLHKMESFISMCKINENKIDAFINTIGFDSFHKVNLHEVLQFSKNDSVSCTSTKSNTDNYGNLTVKAESASNHLEDYIVKTELDADVLESKDVKELRIEDCLECVLVKMEPDEDHESQQNKMNLRSRNRSNRSCSSRLRTHKQLKKRNDETEAKNLTYCSDCNFKTKYKYNLRRHLIIAHKRKDIEINKKFYQCPHCTFCTKWNIDLTRHMLSHIKPETMKCTKCPYSTNQNTQLIKHILSHVNADNIDNYRFLQLTKKTN